MLSKKTIFDDSSPIKLQTKSWVTAWELTQLHVKIRAARQIGMQVPGPFTNTKAGLCWRQILNADMTALAVVKEEVKKDCLTSRLRLIVRTIASDSNWPSKHSDDSELESLNLPEVYASSKDRALEALWESVSAITYVRGV